MKNHICIAVFAAFAAVASTASADLIVHYTFDGDTGNTANDSAGTPQNATITGGSFVSDPARGGVLSMTGTGTNGAYGSVSVTSATGSYTFAAWYKGADTQGYLYDQGASNRLIPSLGSSTQQDPVDGFPDTDLDNAGLGIYDGSGWKNSAAKNTTWTTGQWVHVAWVFENDGLGVGTDSVTIYLNGVAQDVDLGTVGLQTKRAIANIPSLGGTQRLFARYDSSADSNQLTGLIDDYRIYDHALSASEITALITFTNWIAGYPGVGGQTGFNDDPDGDNLDNGIEAFFGTSPAAANPGLTLVSKSGNRFTFQHPEADPALSDVNASYEWATDLDNWHPSGTTGDITVTITPSRNDPETGTTTVTADTAGSATAPVKLFVRVKVSRN